MKKIFTVMLALITCLAFTGSAFAAQTAFNPQLVGTVSISEDQGNQNQGNQNQENQQKWTLMATGKQAPLGEYRYHSTLVVNLHQDGTPQSAKGQGTFTGRGATHKDSISFIIALQFSSPTADPNYPYPFKGTFHVTGGTGRFKGVTGGGDIPQGGANPSAGTFFGDWLGLILVPLLS